MLPATELKCRHPLGVGEGVGEGVGVDVGVGVETFGQTSTSKGMSSETLSNPLVTIAIPFGSSKETSINESGISTLLSMIPSEIPSQERPYAKISQGFDPQRGRIFTRILLSLHSNESLKQFIGSFGSSRFLQEEDPFSSMGISFWLPLLKG